ncbi:hypothetical protein [Kutzneria buriramensis]|uniref:Uncharacterized protein n=1 Tax=Kutzneria buriramensis TaxID=1045776 RepID=A0A3E0GX83_9PSEU|nr:hypothetical protein [Kutzneria buriramensis]REH31176.1 hypothetical protein BCF44_122199 [Kutzneria buriramensis]
MSPEQATNHNDSATSTAPVPPGPRTEDVLRRVVALLRNPTPQTWEDAHDIVLDADRDLTLWQALQDLDDTCPRAKAGDGADGWSGYVPLPLVTTMAIEQAMAGPTDESTTVAAPTTANETYDPKTLVLSLVSTLAHTNEAVADLIDKQARAEATEKKLVGGIRDCAGRLNAARAALADATYRNERQSEVGAVVVPTVLALRSLLRHIACAYADPFDTERDHSDCQQTPVSQVALALYSLCDTVQFEGPAVTQDIQDCLWELHRGFRAESERWTPPATAGRAHT